MVKNATQMRHTFDERGLYSCKIDQIDSPCQMRDTLDEKEKKEGYTLAK